MKYFSALTVGLMLMTNTNSETDGLSENMLNQLSEQSHSISRIHLNTRRSLYYFPFIPRFMVA